MYAFKFLHLQTTLRDQNPDDPEFTPVPDVFRRDKSHKEMENGFCFKHSTNSNETCSRHVPVFWIGK